MRGVRGGPPQQVLQDGLLAAFLTRLEFQLAAQHTDDGLQVDHASDRILFTQNRGAVLGRGADGFGRAIATLGYDVQAAFYQDGFKTLTGRTIPFYFIAVEKDAPYAVAAYQADPLCGAPPSAGLWADLFGGIIELERLERRPLPLPRIPVYLVAGSRDPVSLGRFGLGQLARRYRSHGVSDVTVRVYRGGRHEMHNETNRHEVLADLLAWLNSRLWLYRKPRLAAWYSRGR